MMRGFSCHELWVDLDSLPWLVSYAADEHSHDGTIRPWGESHPRHKEALNLPGVPGVWTSYNARFKRYCFEFIEPVDGLPESELKSRRYLALGSLTDIILNLYLWDATFEEATLSDKRDMAFTVIKAWCVAILNGRETAFLETHGLPPWIVRPNAAQADNVSADAPEESAAHDSPLYDAIIASQQHELSTYEQIIRAQRRERYKASVRSQNVEVLEFSCSICGRKAKELAYPFPPFPNFGCPEHGVDVELIEHDVGEQALAELSP